MLKQYSIEEVIKSPKKKKGYFIGRFEDTDEEIVEWPHRHGFYSLLLFTAGKGINVIDFEEYQILAGRLFFISPKQVHNWSYAADTTGFIIVFEEHLLPAGIESNLPPLIDLEQQDLSFFKPLIERLLVEYSAGDELSEPIVRTAIPFLLHLFQRHQSREQVFSRDDASVIRKFQKLIAENFAKSLTVGSYARLLGLSQRDLNEQCRLNKGLSAKQLILDYKLTEAKRLLLFTDLSVSEITYRLGFEDPSYFARMFRKNAGVSPSSFRINNPSM